MERNVVKSGILARQRGGTVDVMDAALCSDQSFWTALERCESAGLGIPKVDTFLALDQQRPAIRQKHHRGRLLQSRGNHFGLETKALAFITRLPRYGLSKRGKDADTRAGQESLK